tara:strand:+ start:1458 stop:2111 length:654 start_codon:yes stop_codon:yes gene_type:complete
MALTSSGAISLNEIHVEAGGSSGSICSINDSDIRGLISKGPGATMAFNEWYGASAAAADVSTTMTIGGDSSTETIQYVGTTRVRFRGFSSSTQTYDSGATSLGSLGSTSFTGYFGGNTITDLHVRGTSFSSFGNPPYGATTLQFSVNAENVSNSNSSFKKLLVGSTTYNRSDATYSTGSGKTHWTWTAGSNAPDNNTSTMTPFGSAGGTVTITFKQV